MDSKEAAEMVAVLVRLTKADGFEAETNTNDGLLGLEDNQMVVWRAGRAFLVTVTDVTEEMDA